MYALIPAGGSGSRLWPLSRSSFPKHLLDLSGQGSMIQETVQRVSPLIAADETIVLTAHNHAAAIIEQLPGLPPQNIVIEPARRDTAPVIGLGAFHVYHRDPKAILASLHSDHVILQNETFLKLLKVAEDIAAKHDVIVTLGISPDHPATGYGYIASGKEFCKINGVEVFRVQNFTEKPNLPTAKAFLSAGNYFWNAGMFIARAEVLLAAYKQHTPQTYQFLSTIAAAIGTDREQATLEKIYPTIPKEPIDTAIMEKLNNIVVIPADIGWSDIGSWKAVKEILPKNAETNFVFGQHVGIDTENSLVYSSGSRLIATIGLKDMVIVESEDAILICPVSAAEKVKELVSMIKAEKRDSYL